MHKKLSKLSIAAVVLGMLAVPVGASAHEDAACVLDRVCTGTHRSVQAIFESVPDGEQVRLTVEHDGNASIFRRVRLEGGGGTNVSAAGVLQGLEEGQAPVIEIDFGSDGQPGSARVLGRLVPSATQDPGGLIEDTVIDLEWSEVVPGSPLLATPATTAACGPNGGPGAGESRVGKVTGSAWGAATNGLVSGQPVYQYTCAYVKT